MVVLDSQTSFPVLCFIFNPDGLAYSKQHYYRTSQQSSTKTRFCKSSSTCDKFYDKNAIFQLAGLKVKKSKWDDLCILKLLATSYLLSKEKLMLSKLSPFEELAYFSTLP
jgi:hypothetical protein